MSSHRYPIQQSRTTNVEGDPNQPSFGCTDPTACNYWYGYNTDDGSCRYAYEVGCGNSFADNYIQGQYNGTGQDGECPWACEFHAGCINPDADNYDHNTFYAVDTLGMGELNDEGSCIFPDEPIPIVQGCTNENADNYNPNANLDDESCEFLGCTNPDVVNFDPFANVDDGSCEAVGDSKKKEVDYTTTYILLGAGALLLFLISRKK